MAVNRNTPRKQIQKTCEWCKESYTSFRLSSKYCTDECRALAWQERHPTVRPEVLKRDGYRCRECGSGEGMLFVRFGAGVPHTIENGRTLCGRCHSALSIQMFREREPDATKGRNYRRNIENATKVAEDD